MAQRTIGVFSTPGGPALGQVIIAENACHAVWERRPSPGWAPTIGVTTRALPGLVELRIRDDGSGIAEQIRPRLFEPFVTSKPPGQGTGLGLSLAYDIVVQGHGGSIAVTSEPGLFTEFVITLPLNGGAAVS